MAGGWGGVKAWKSGVVYIGRISSRQTTGGDLAYSLSVIFFCSDFGTESGIPEVPDVLIDAMFADAIHASGGLIENGQVNPTTHRFSFGNCLLVLGMKHIMDNIQKDATRLLSFYEEFEEMLRPLVDIMNDKDLRERLAHRCFLGTPYLEHMLTWEGGTHTKWRWSSLVTCCKALRLRKKALTKFWDEAKFAGEAPSNPENSATDGKHRKLDAKFVKICTKAIHSKMFWAYMDFIIVLHGFIDELSSWCEGCSCHEAENGEKTWHKRRKAIDKTLHGRGVSAENCVFKGRRANELADDFLERVLRRLVSLCATSIIPEVDLPPEDQRILLQDWNASSDIIIATLQIKLSYWRNLPHKLAGLAVDDEDRARVIAQECVDLFELAPGNHHRMTLRFLDYHFQGDYDHDIPLRPQLDRFIAGEALKNLPELQTWIMGLRLIRIVERPTEAIHKGIHKTCEHAPNSTAAYVSTEARAHNIETDLADPHYLAMAADQNENLTDLAGLSAMVASTVGGEGAYAASTFETKDACKLLYGGTLTQLFEDCGTASKAIDGQKQRKAAQRKSKAKLQTDLVEAIANADPACDQEPGIPQSGLRRLMLNHFHTVCQPGVLYSLPKELARRLPQRSVATAASSSSANVGGPMPISGPRCSTEELIKTLVCG